MFTNCIAKEETYRDEILRQAKQSLALCFARQRQFLQQNKQVIELTKEEQLKELELAKNTLLQKEEILRLYQLETSHKINDAASTMKSQLKSACAIRVGVQMSAQIGINAKGQLATSDHQVTFSMK